MSQPIECTPGGKSPVPPLVQAIADRIEYQSRPNPWPLSPRTIALGLVELVADHIRNAPAGGVDPILVAAWIARDPFKVPAAAPAPDLRMEDHA